MAKPLDEEYVITHAADVIKYVRELEAALVKQKEEITTSVQLSQEAKKWWQKLGLD